MQYTNITGVMDIKSDLHKIIDKIQDEQLLQALLNFLKSREGNPSGKIWHSLTEVQRQEVLQAYEESENEENLLNIEDFFDEEK